MNEPLENPYQSPMAPPGEERPSLNATLPAVISGITTFVSTFLILGAIVFIGALVLAPEAIYTAYHPGGLAAVGLLGFFPWRLPSSLAGTCTDSGSERTIS